MVSSGPPQWVQALEDDKSRASRQENNKYEILDEGTFPDSSPGTRHLGPILRRLSREESRMAHWDEISTTPRRRPNSDARGGSTRRMMSVSFPKPSRKGGGTAQTVSAPVSKSCGPRSLPARALCCPTVVSRGASKPRSPAAGWAAGFSFGIDGKPTLTADRSTTNPSVHEESSDLNRPLLVRIKSHKAFCSNSGSTGKV